jgi:hypothetical protein
VKTNPFKVGDIVIVTDASGDANARIGDIVEVVEMQLNFNPCLTVKRISDGTLIKQYWHRFSWPPKKKLSIHE